MNVTGKTTLFVEDRKGYNFIVASVSHKNQDGTYINTSIDLRFNKTKFPKENLAKLEKGKAYSFEITDGWLDCEAYEVEGKSKRNLFIFVNDGKLLDSKDVKQKAKNNLPF